MSQMVPVKQQMSNRIRGRVCLWFDESYARASQLKGAFLLLTRGGADIATSDLQEVTNPITDLELSNA
jgi:hypothetical protein